MKKLILSLLLLLLSITFVSAQRMTLRCYESRILQSPSYYHYKEDFTIKIPTLDLNKRQTIEFSYPISTVYNVTFKESESMTDFKEKRFLFISGEIHNSNKYKRIFISYWYETGHVWVTLDNGLIIIGEKRETAYYCILQTPTQKPY